LIACAFSPRAVSGMTSSQPSWMEVGEKNLETMDKLQKIELDLVAGVVDKDMVASCMAQMRGFYAPKVSLKMMPHSKALTGHQSLCQAEDLTIDESFALIYKQFAGLKIHKGAHTHVALDFMSGGTTIIVSKIQDMSSVDSTGAEVPGTRHDNVGFMTIYSFDAEGKIAAAEMHFDTLLVEDMKKRAAQHEKTVHQHHHQETVHQHHDHQEAGSVIEVAERNLATVEKLQELRIQMAGTVIDQKMLADFQEQMKDLYAPKVSLKMMPQSKGLTEHQSLCHKDDLTVDELFAAMYNQWAGMKQNKLTFPHNAVDMKLGGKVILSKNVFGVALTDSAGVEIPGTTHDNVQLMEVCSFNDQGKIVGLEIMFDTLLVENMKNRAAHHEDTVMKAGA